MKYLMLVKHPERFWNAPPPQALMDAMGKYVTESLASGTVVDTAGLRPSRDGARVRLAGGRLTTTDGPFTEAKEIIGGYAIFEARSKEHAVQLGNEFMELHRRHWPEFEGECEIRPLAEMG